jgi:hypothetical protein
VSDERALALDEFIRKKKETSDVYNQTHNLEGVSKTRKNVRENFSYILVNN